MPTHAHTSILRLAVVAVAAIVAAGLSPLRGAAACGEYVHILKPGESLAAPLGQPHEGVPGKPCDGPNCSGKPGTLPPLTAPVAGTSDSKQWAARENDDLDGDTGSCVLTPPCSEGTPVQVTCAIFHPPRA